MRLNMKPGKTYKREVAVLQLVLHWGLVAGITYLEASNPGYDPTALINLATGLAVWVYGFAATAFGLDAFSKQITPARRATPALTQRENTLYE